jgi:hypothetical protein
LDERHRDDTEPSESATRVVVDSLGAYQWWPRKPVEIRPADPRSFHQHWIYLPLVETQARNGSRAQECIRIYRAAPESYRRLTITHPALLVVCWQAGVTVEVAVCS